MSIEIGDLLIDKHTNVKYIAISADFNDFVSGSYKNVHVKSNSMIIETIPQFIWVVIGLYGSWTLGIKINNFINS